MKIYKITSKSTDFPELLSQIPDCPKQLFFISDNLENLLKKPRVAIVGSRKVSPYGKMVTTKLAGELAKHGVVIISGLAIGVDGIAHRGALEANGQTIAVLPCGLDRIYPSIHRGLAKQIIEKGGALISEYPEETEPMRHHFIARNRIVSGLSDGLLITEAAQKSGTLHTANFALEQGKEVFAVPGNITSALSAGTNNLIKTGATPVTDVEDILQSLGYERGLNRALPLADNNEEQAILDVLISGISDGAQILMKSKLEPPIFSQTLTMLEISGKIKPLGNGHWSLS